MATRHLHPQFRDENASSRYPFSDLSRLTTGTGHTLPTELVTDAALYPIGNVLPLYLRRIELDGLLAAIVIGTALDDLCRSEFDLTDPDGTVVLVDDLRRPAGVLLCDPVLLQSLRGWGNGNHVFDNRAEFVATVGIPTPENGVRGLSAEAGKPLTGDVWLVGEDGVILTEENGAVRVDITGEPLWRRALCDTASNFVSPNFVRTINGIAPDSYGNWQFTAGRVLTGRPAMRIYPDDKALVISLALPGQ